MECDENVCAIDCYYLLHIRIQIHSRNKKKACIYVSMIYGWFFLKNIDKCSQTILGLI